MPWSLNREGRAHGGQRLPFAVQLPRSSIGSSSHLWASCGLSSRPTNVVDFAAGGPPGNRSCPGRRAGGMVTGPTVGPVLSVTGVSLHGFQLRRRRHGRPFCPAFPFVFVISVTSVVFVQLP